MLIVQPKNIIIKIVTKNLQKCYILYIIVQNKTKSVAQIFFKLFSLKRYKKEVKNFFSLKNCFFYKKIKKHEDFIKKNSIMYCFFQKFIV